MKNRLYTINISIILGLFFCLPMSLTAAPNNNQIFYTSSDGDVVTPYDTKVFGVNIVSNEYKDGLGIITFDGNVTSIGDGAFFGCLGLTSITLPNSVTSIGDGAFFGCLGLTSITIPNSVTTIGEGAFRSCIGLTSINIDASNKYYASIDGVLFNYAKNTLVQYPIGNTRTEYAIPNSVTTIGETAFYSCQGLTSVTIPNSVTTIGEGAFEYCSGLTSVTIPNSVTTIGEWAFDGCKGLISVTIGNSVTTIGDRAFQNCSVLTSVTCEATTPPTCGSDCFYNVSTSIPVYVPAGSVDAYKNTYPWSEFTNIQPIGGGDDCKPISGTCGKNLTWELSCDSILTISGTGEMYDYNTKNHAPWYSNCDKIKYSIIEEGVTTIGDWAFGYCIKLNSITIPNSVTTIGDWAFGYCFMLNSITIPNSVTTIGESAFSLCIGLTSINIDASNKYYASIDGVLFNYAKNTLIQYPVGNTRTEYAIPNSVTKIGNQAFYSCQGLTSVTIPNSVTTIGDVAFAGCSNLTSITCQAITPPTCSTDKYPSFVGIPTSIPVYVPAISVDTYKQTNEWNNFTNILPIEVDCVVASGTCGTDLTWKLTCDSVLTISGIGEMDSYSDYKFSPAPWYSNCDKIKYCIIEDGIISIGGFAFYGCRDLTSITIPSSVTSIRENAFSDCNGLASVTIGNSVTTIGDYAFSECTGLTSITCQATMSPSCGSDCFKYVDKSIPLYVPEESISAYQKAKGWSEFTNIKAIPDYTHIYYTSSDGKVVTPYKTDAFGANIISNEYKDGQGVITFDGNVTKIVSSAFRFCKSLTSIEIPASVTTIGEEAFYECSSLTSIEIPASVTTIGEEAFYECSSLTSIEIPASVVTIGVRAFARCTSITSITIGESVATIGDYALPIGFLLTSINVDASNKYYASENGVLFTYAKDTLILYPTGNTRTEYTIPNSVTTIGKSAFWGCSALTTVIVPNSVTTIGESAFAMCLPLTSIELPSSITTIGDAAFLSTSLTSIKIGNSVTTIGDYAFSECIRLTSITCEAVTPPTCGTDCFDGVTTSIPVYVPAGSVDAYKKADQWSNFTNIQPIPGTEPDYTHIYYTSSDGKVVTPYKTDAFGANIVSNEYKDGQGIITFAGKVTKIGEDAFYHCSGLTSVTIPNSVTTIEYDAFYLCSGLTSVTIPNSVTTIGERAFPYCTGLTSVTIPNSVTTIGDEAFDLCTGLTSVTIGKSVTTIGYRAFEFCKGLTSITCEAVTPPSCGYYCFDDVSIYIPVYVPAGSVDAYKKANVWKNFTNIQPIGGGDDCEPISGTCGANLTWELSCDSVLTISGTGRMDDYPLKDKQPTSPWAEYMDAIDSIYISEGVTTIGKYAFRNASNVTGVFLPASLDTIHLHAFYGCKSLVNFILPEGLQSIELNAFYNIGSISKLVLPSTLAKIGASGIYCRSLTELTCLAEYPPYLDSEKSLYNIDYSIPLYVPYQSIDTYKQANIWKNFSNIQAIPGTEPNNVITYTATSKLTETTSSSSGLHTDAFNVSITSHTFSNGTGTITFAGDVTTIGDFAFDGCSGLTSITIPNSVMTIGDAVFQHCSGLTSITIPNSVTSIGDYAFSSCTGLPSIEIPNSVTTIGERAFQSCEGLISVMIGNSVKTIGENAFFWCTGFTSITIPNSVTSIGNNAFYYVNNVVYSGTAKGSPWGAKCVNGYVDGYLVYTDASQTTLVGCSSAPSEINIPNSVTTIGKSAFEGYHGLTSITIGNSVTKIGNWALAHCTSLTSITCEAVTPPTCGAYCFQFVSISIPLYVPYESIDAYKQAGEWKKFTNIQPIPGTEPNNVITYTATKKLTETTDTYSNGLHTNAFNVAITSHTFANGVGTITFAGDVTTIGEDAFYYCSGLTSITIPNSVTTIGYHAFYFCSALTSITIPYSVTTIDGTAFWECSKLKTTNYTGTIADWCKIKFDGTTANPMYYSHNFYINDVEVQNLVIPEGVDKISDYAFYSCSGLTSVTIGNSVIEIGKDAFSDCTGLTSITCEAVTPPSCGSYCFYNVSTSIPVYVPAGSMGDYKMADEWKKFYNIQPIPGSVPKNVITYMATKKMSETTDTKSIGLHTNAFNVAITSHTFANGVGTITFDGDVITIGDYAFYGCYDLTSVTIGNSVTAIGVYAFHGCGLITVTIPNSIITIEPSAFNSCSNLTSFYVDATNTHYATIDGVLFNYAKDIIVSYPCGKELTAYTIPNSVTMIGDYAFNDCFLTSITIPNSVTTIGENAFGSCCGFTSITIPNSVITIGEYAFYNCCNLKSITIPYSVTTIGTYAFCECISLISVTLSNSVTAIGDGAFYGCLGLTSITIPNSVTTIGKEAFGGCSVLTSINVDASNKYYCSIDGVLFNYAKDTLIQYPIGNARKEYTIPSSVTTIGYAAFLDCGLVSVTIGNSVTTIENYAFSGCSGLTSITCEATTPPTCGEYCFNYVTKSIPLYVPKSSISAYQTANQWKDFTNIRALEDRTDFDINNTTTTISELEAWVTVPLDAKGEVTKYSYWLYLDNAHTDLVCSMDFDAAGKMSNPVIRKAPTQQQAEEEQTFDSFTFEVSGLEANTTYYYVLKAFTNAKTFTKEGSFTTQSSAVRKAPSQVRKVCKQNQILFEVDGNTYDIWGNKH